MLAVEDLYTHFLHPFPQLSFQRYFLCTELSQIILLLEENQARPGCLAPPTFSNLLTFTYNPFFYYGGVGNPGRSLSAFLYGFVFGSPVPKRAGIAGTGENGYFICVSLILKMFSFLLVKPKTGPAQVGISSSYNSPSWQVFPY